MTPDKIKDLIIFNRNIELAVELEKYTNNSLIALQKSVDRARNEIIAHLESKGSKIRAWDKARSEKLLDEMTQMTKGIREKTGSIITKTSVKAFDHALKQQNDIYSFGDRVKGFNNVSLSPVQLYSLVVNTPVGGNLLAQNLPDGRMSWVNRMFDNELKQKIKGEISAGMLKGESYPALVKRIEQGFNDISRREAYTLTRTYVQSVNTRSMEMVYAANDDIIKGVEWNATLESGYWKTGHGTCPACAALDGQRWKMGEQYPPIPLHPNCRCIPLPVTKSYKELGLNMSEIKNVYRPYTTRPDKAIKIGGRTIIQTGVTKHRSYKDFYMARGKEFQTNVVGPARQQLIADHVITFNEIVDPATGDLIPLVLGPDGWTWGGFSGPGAASAVREAYPGLVSSTPIPRENVKMPPQAAPPSEPEPPAQKGWKPSKTRKTPKGAVAIEEKKLSLDIDMGNLGRAEITKDNITMYHMTTRDRAEQIFLEAEFRSGEMKALGQTFESHVKGTYGWASLERAGLEVARATDELSDMYTAAELLEAKRDTVVLKIKLPRSKFERFMRPDEDWSFEIAKWRESAEEFLSMAVERNFSTKYIDDIYCASPIKNNRWFKPKVAKEKKIPAKPKVEDKFKSKSFSERTKTIEERQKRIKKGLRKLRKKKK